MNNDFAVQLTSLKKNYGKFSAISDINLELAPNKIYGLLGRNGAGKTTILNLLTARVFPTSGTAKVFGSEAFENIKILEKLCFIEEKGYYASMLRVKDALKLCKGLYPSWDSDYEKRLLKLFELDENKSYKQLSRGMESTLGLIIGLASRASLTIFDEPSLGLDAVIRERFYDEVINDFTENPRTIIISTHLIDEVSRLFEDIIIIDSGRLLLKANAQDLKEKAFFVSGCKDEVQKVTKNMIVLSKESFANIEILGVYSNNSIQSDNVEISPMPLQKLFTYLINPDIHVKLQKGGVIL